MDKVGHQPGVKKTNANPASAHPCAVGAAAPRGTTRCPAP